MNSEATIENTPGSASHSTPRAQPKLGNSAIPARDAAIRVGASSASASVANIGLGQVGSFLGRSVAMGSTLQVGAIAGVISLTFEVASVHLKYLGNLVYSRLGEGKIKGFIDQGHQSTVICCSTRAATYAGAAAAIALAAPLAGLTLTTATVVKIALVAFTASEVSRACQ